MQAIQSIVVLKTMTMFKVSNAKNVHSFVKTQFNEEERNCVTRFDTRKKSVSIKFVLFLNSLSSSLSYTYTDPTDSDENDLTDSEDYSLDNRAIYNSFNDGAELLYPMLADSVQGRSPSSAPLAPSLFPHVPPFITFASHDVKGPQMPLAIKKVLKWKLTTITPIVIRKILLNSGFRLLKREFVLAFSSYFALA